MIRLSEHGAMFRIARFEKTIPPPLGPKRNPPNRQHFRRFIFASAPSVFVDDSRVGDPGGDQQEAHEKVVQMMLSSEFP
jgi:hypothetical protein